MAETPRSRSISRASTPGLSRPSPSRLTISPSLRPTPSLSNLHIHGHASTPPVDIPLLPAGAVDNILDSSASSVIDMDPAEGILVQDIDADAEHTDAEDIGMIDKSGIVTTQDEGPKQMLRDQLRNLSQRATLPDAESPRTRSGRLAQVQDLTFDEGEDNACNHSNNPIDDENPANLYLPREYFVLTDAGKPVFISRPGGGDQDGMASTIGIMQALISVFLDDNDKLRAINAGRTRITFLLRPPLYYACVSSWGEPESVLEDEGHVVHYLNCQLPSHHTSQTKEALDPPVRQVQWNNFPSPSNCALADLHIIMNTIHSPSIFNSPASASWIPVCLPKFNPAGFVNTYITFLRKDNTSQPQDTPIALSGDDASSSVSGESSSSGKSDPQEGLNESGIALVCVSVGGDFELIRNWCDTVKMTTDGTLNALIHAYQTKEMDYSVSELGIPGLRHFVYKSRTQVQITLPTFEDPYDQTNARKRIMTLYQVLHDSIHAKSGQDGGLKLQYIRTDMESVMGWITQPFELYIALSPLLPKSAAVGAANAVARWVKREEARLFLRDAPVF
ncbi:hypothetical protein NLJ89_g9305 [Agrocybe chaxingu]|uniref:Vacuolar fusion protein MON1 n=1 Tax=Agrocybe chaxingu TaxID=84603 RepID=A0A9W8JTL1_9AGAR|nr:hypothetical protein NLJ89_g9305 [Agrocybe chaxingu]